MAKSKLKSSENLIKRKSTSIDSNNGETNQRKKSLDSRKNSVKGKKEIKYGGIPVFRNQRFWARFVVIFAVMVIVYFATLKEKERKFAKQREIIPYRFQKLQCSSAFINEISNFPSCIPKTCGRFVTDSIVSPKEVDVLLKLAKTALKFGGGNGGASIFDIQTGALSQGDSFVNIFQLPEAKNIFNAEDVVVYKLVKAKIQHAIADTFSIDENALYLTSPSFFSRMTNVTAKTIHDEYWHLHIDKETYNSFHFTSLLYLTDHSKDFDGGRFIFVDGKEKNRTISSIEPKKGRVSFFSSGAENPHYVEKVVKGTRFAITISFTCNKEFESNPTLDFES